MNPIVFSLGPLQIRAFTAWIAGAVAVATVIILAVALCRHEKLLPWLDAAVGAVVGGVIGARAVHVWLNWDYFSANTDQITALSSGGLDWHGAVMGGLLAAILVAFVRRVSPIALTDAFALVLPIAAAAGWLACAAANSAYGVEVPTLADYPSWLVIESPDVYGIIAPRLNLLPLALALCTALLVIVGVFTALGWFSGSRLWLVLALFGIGMALIDFFRAEYVPLWLGHRADQILDLAVAFAAILLFAIISTGRRKVGFSQFRRASLLWI